MFMIRCNIMLIIMLAEKSWKYFPLFSHDLTGIYINYWKLKMRLNYELHVTHSYGLTIILCNVYYHLGHTIYIFLSDKTIPSSCYITVVTWALLFCLICLFESAALGHLMCMTGKLHTHAHVTTIK